LKLLDNAAEKRKIPPSTNRQIGDSFRRPPSHQLAERDQPACTRRIAWAPFEQAVTTALWGFEPCSIDTSPEQGF